MKLEHGLAAGIALAAPAIMVTVAASAAPARPAALPACGTSLLTWFAPQGNGFTGGAGYVVEFSNIGTTTCTVKGFPTVKLTENGNQVGLKATTSGPAPATVTLKRGQTAHVALIIRDAGAICTPSPTNGLSVKPPGNTQASNFRLVAFGACPGKSTMSVDAINPGVGIPFFTIH
ncbi:MAG TPA: DUF4232 domain-containing protein [Streptosporangiaceae bacterium]|nr:DUF4232 domain-containing protein [Streptosporangiaceae bacterium]